jgi:exosortase A
MELSRPASLKIPWLVMGVVLIAIPLALSDTFVSMIQMWINSRTFNHCFLIPPASAFLIWGRREQLSKVQPAASLSGIVLVISAGLLWILGSLANAAIIQNLAAVAFFPLSVWTVLGRRVTREIAFPLFYLFFMIPFGEFLIPRLMDITADFTVAAVRLSGVPIYRDGLFLTIPNGSFKIVDACSGVRILIASVAVGVLFAHLSFDSWWRKILFLSATIFLAIVTNGLRAYGVVMIGYLIGMDAAGSHIWLGNLLFGILIIVLLVVGSRFSDKHIGEPIPVRLDTLQDLPSNLRGFLSAGVVIAVVALTPIMAGALHASISGQAPPESLELPVATRPWMGPSGGQTEWAPVYVGNYAKNFAQYVRGSTVVDVYTITYGYQTQGSELISSENTIFDPELWIQVRENAATTQLPSGQRWNYIETELLAGDRKRLIRYWYTVNNQSASSRIQIKLAELKNAVQGRPSSSSVIAISTEFFDDVQAASATLDEFYATVFAESSGQSD